MSHHEVHGARIFSGLEPFGYRDSKPAGTEGYPPALVDAVTGLVKDRIDPAEWIERLRDEGLLPPEEKLRNEAAVLAILQRIAVSRAALAESNRSAAAMGGAGTRSTNEFFGFNGEPRSVALLYQRYRHKLGSFDPNEAERNIGKAPFQLQQQADPPEGSHLQVTRDSHEAEMLMRRGFAYRSDNGDEGLAFVALANRSDIFEEALRRHLESDRLFRMTTALEGGIYVVPPGADELLEHFGLGSRLELVRAQDQPVIPAIAAQLLRPRASPIPGLIDYPVAAELRDYVTLARAKGMFLEPTMHLRPDIEALMVQIEVALGAKKDLADIREKIRAVSEAVYEQNGGYLVLGA
jgi:hypothetical protein